MTTPEPQRTPAPDPAPGTSVPASSAGTQPPAAPSLPASQSVPAAAAVKTSRKRRRGREIGLGLVGALLVFVTVVLVLFVMFNTQTVDISLVFGNVQAPLVLALVVAAVLGGLIVSLAGAAVRARRKGR